MCGVGSRWCVCCAWCFGPYRRYCDVFFLVQGGAREPQSGFPDGAGVGRGGAGGVVQFLDKVVDVPVVWVCFVVAVQQGC